MLFGLCAFSLLSLLRGEAALSHHVISEYQERRGHCADFITPVLPRHRHREIAVSQLMHCIGHESDWSHDPNDRHRPDSSGHKNAKDAEECGLPHQLVTLS